MSAGATESESAAGVPQALEGVKRAIVVAGHADDMETIMGGTAWLLTEHGVELFELICTLGDLGAKDERLGRQGMAEMRKEEARNGGSLLKLAGVATLDYHDGELEPTLELRAEIARYYRLWQVDTLFTFDPSWVGQIHPDHRAAGRAAIDAIMPSRMRLYHPEQAGEGGTANISRAFLFSPAAPSLFVDITGVYDRKLAACRAHLSQFPRGDSDLEWMLELDRNAAGRSGLGVEFAEAFMPLRVW